ncbi:hypothetical protein KYG_10320 [Acidovorax sp. NO-1]|nr:hypothetical protein KYG_10320 [Acidovorax sp. NO-1]
MITLLTLLRAGLPTHLARQQKGDTATPLSRLHPFIQ